MIDEVIRAQIAAAAAAGEHAEAAQLWRELRDLYPVGITPGALAALTPEFIAAQVAADAQRAYDRREAELSEPIMRELERRVTMAVIDRVWRGHRATMSGLVDELGARSADRTVPLPDYQREAALRFAAMESAVKRDTIHDLFNLEVEVTEVEVT